MKCNKLLSIMMMVVLMFSTAVAFSSCSKDDEDLQTSLKGTKWTVTYSGDKYVCEFTSNSDVQSYEADINGNYLNYLHEDTYTFDGTNVKFRGEKLVITDVIGLSGCYYYYFKSAVVTGNKMVVTTECIKLNINISTGDYSTENRGTKTFTFMKI